MNENYEKAVKMLDSVKKECVEKKEVLKELKRESPKGRYLAVFLIVLIIIFFASFYYVYSGKMARDQIVVSAIESLNATIEGAKIEYSTLLKHFENNWTRLDVKVVYLKAPWDSYLAYFWYNTETEEYRIVPRE